MPKVKYLHVHNVEDWLVLQEFYFLVEKTRVLLLSSTCFEEMREAEISLNEMISFFIKNIHKKGIKPDELCDFSLPENYQKIQHPDGYNTNYYSKLVGLYHSQVNLFNFIVEGRYKQFLKKHPNW